MRPKYLIIVVSLESARSRRDAFAKDAPQDESWRFFDASEVVDPLLRYDARLARTIHGRELSKGELGCYSSHYRLWYNLCEDNQYAGYIILEDDVLVDWEFLKKASYSNDIEADYVRLYYRRPVRSRERKRGIIDHSRSLIEIHGYAYGTQGYIINKDGARKFLELFQCVERPIDDALDRVWHHGVPNLCLFPFPIMERIVPSDIEKGRSRISKRSPINVKNITEKLRYQLSALRFRLDW